MKGGLLRARPSSMRRIRPRRRCALVARRASSSLPEPAAPPKPPDILLITLDTARADRMGFLGSSRGLDAVARRVRADGHVFERAFAQAPITTVSHATILTGTYPPFHRVDDFGAPLPAIGAVSCPTSCKAAGLSHGRRSSVRSSSIRATARRPDSIAASTSTMPAFASASPARIAIAPSSGAATMSRPRARVACEQVEGSPGAPSFLWVHLFDPHDPYDPPADLARRDSRRSLYDGEDRLRRSAGRPLWSLPPARCDARRRSATTAKSLGDHGETTHGVFLYDATLHVPLLVRSAWEGAARGARVTTRVRLADVAPTLLESAGLRRAGGDAGPVAAAADRDGRSGGSRRLCGELVSAPRLWLESARSSWRADRFLYVRAPKRELYDLVDDPGASKNLAPAGHGSPMAWTASLRIFSRRSDRATPRRPASIPRRGRRALPRSATSAGSRARRKPTGIDPKDRIAIANLLHEAILAVEDGAFRARDPAAREGRWRASRTFRSRSSISVSHARGRGSTRAAIPPLERAATLQPGTCAATTSSASRSTKAAT